MKDKKSLIKKYFVVTIGQVIIGIGSAFLVTSGMGNDPMGVMVSGISGKTGISFGTVTNIVNMIFFVLLLAFYRKRLSFTTLITVVAIGWAIDPAVAFLQSVKAPVFVNNYIYPLVGCVIISCGVAFYLSVNMGASITDNVILRVADMAGKGYSFGCYLMYAVFFTVGLILGGVWGYATLIALVFNGKMIDFMMPKFEKTVGRWANQ